MVAEKARDRMPFFQWGIAVLVVVVAIGGFLSLSRSKDKTSQDLNGGPTASIARNGDDATDGAGRALEALSEARVEPERPVAEAAVEPDLQEPKAVSPESGEGDANAQAAEDTLRKVVFSSSVEEMVDSQVLNAHRIRPTPEELESFRAVIAEKRKHIHKAFVTHNRLRAQIGFELARSGQYEEIPVNGVKPPPDFDGQIVSAPLFGDGTRRLVRINPGDYPDLDAHGADLEAKRNDLYQSVLAFFGRH